MIYHRWLSIRHLQLLNPWYYWVRVLFIVLKIGAGVSPRVIGLFRIWIKDSSKRFWKNPLKPWNPLYSCGSALKRLPPWYFKVCSLNILMCNGTYELKMGLSKSWTSTIIPNPANSKIWTNLFYFFSYIRDFLPLMCFLYWWKYVSKPSVLDKKLLRNMTKMDFWTSKLSSSDTKRQP